MNESEKITIGKATLLFKSKDELLNKLENLKNDLEKNQIIIEQSADGIMISKPNGIRFGSAGLTL